MRGWRILVFRTPEYDSGVSSMKNWHAICQDRVPTSARRTLSAHHSMEFISFNEPLLTASGQSFEEVLERMQNLIEETTQQTNIQEYKFVDMEVGLKR